MKSMHILSLDHFSSVIFRHDIVYLQLQGRIVNSLYHVSRLKLISPIASHWQGDGPYQMPRRCQCVPPCHLKPRRLFIYSSKDSVMWCFGSETLTRRHILFLRARRQSRLRPVIRPGSAEVVPATPVCPYSVIRHLRCYCIPVL